MLRRLSAGRRTVPCSPRSAARWRSEPSPGPAPHRVALCALLPRQPAQRVLQVLLQLLNRSLHLVLPLRRPGVEVGRLHHLAILHRRHREAHRRAQNRDALGRRLVTHRGEAALVAAADLLLDAATTLLVVLALECSGQRDLQVVDQMIERLVQRRRRPGRQCDRHGPMRRREVVDIDPVRRLLAPARARLPTGSVPIPGYARRFAPMAKMLKPRTAISVPKRIASCARGCSANPCSGASSRVVAKSSAAISAARYSRSGGSGGMGVAQLTSPAESWRVP